jgi:hypothetical protein
VVPVSGRAYPFWPGVPAAGHVAGGHWHPGPVDGCVKCEPAPPRRRAGQWLDRRGARGALMTGPAGGPGVHDPQYLASILSDAARQAPEPLRLGGLGVTVLYANGTWQVTWHDRGGSRA